MSGPLTEILLTPETVYRLDGLINAAYVKGVEPLLVLDAAAPLQGDDRIFAWDFITYRLLDEDAPRLGRDRITYYQALRDHLGPEAGPAPNPATIIGKDTGNDARGYSKTEQRRAMLGDVIDVLWGGVRAHLLADFKGISPKPKRADDPPMKRVLLIGAYGGEHIGDGAILGGVLHRISARHGTTQAILMTQRPYHTIHLMPMLETPVTVDVQEYTLANITAALRDVDGVVFAGGPLTDIPKQLVRHLYTAAKARRRGLPFVMEGVGPSTFIRMPSFFTARRFINMADRITIRTRDDAARRLVKGCDLEIGRDPAFDYLETRGKSLSRLRAEEPGQINELLKDASGRRIIGVNIRPIGHAFTPPASSRDPVTYTAEVQDQFEQEFAAGLEAWAATQDSAPVFVFFPMNAIQFGMSDLRSAHRIGAHLKAQTDYRVWEADVSLDGAVALIRRCDAVVSMRFHATIFALSQNIPTLGIDYRIGKRDKVAAVLSDAGFPDNVIRIDQLDASWLIEKLTTLLPKG